MVFCRSRFAQPGVSTELSGEVWVIDRTTNRVEGPIAFEPTGGAQERRDPVGLVTQDGKTAYVTLGHANHVAVVDLASRKTTDYILVGNRPWGLRLSSDEKTLYVANGLSDDITIIDVPTRKGARLGAGRPGVPYGILVDDAVR